MSERLFEGPVHLVGQHVELVRLATSHVPALAVAAQDREAVQFLRAPPGPSAREAAAWVERWVWVGQVGPDLPLAILLRATGQPIGMTSFLRLDRPSRGVEIGGTLVAPQFWRTPVNTDAKWLLLRYAFEEAGFHRVQLQTDLRNVRSQRAIEGLGAVPEARLRDDVLLSDGSFRTSVYYSVLEAEWPSVRGRLEARLSRAWTPPEPTLAHRGGPSVALLPLVSSPERRPLNFRPPLTLRGQHVTLLPLERSQLPELIEAGSDPEIWTLLRIRHGDTPEGMAGLVDDLLGLQESGAVLPFVVRMANSGRLVGICRYLDIDRENRWVELGTWLHPSVWRTPANTELKLLLLRHAFDSEGVHRVQLKTDGRNARSQQAIERLGAVYEGERRDHYRFPNGDYRTSKYYSLLAPEWPAARQRLEEMLRRPWPAIPPPSA